MRRITVLISTLAFAISGFVISPASADPQVPQVPQVANATPATFAPGIQSSSPVAWFESISCSSAGNCVAVGAFANATGGNEAFTQTQTNGVWADAIPATFASGIQNSNPYASFVSVSCSSAGNCVAVGQFKNAAGDREAMTQTQTNGQWADAIPATFASGIQNSTPIANLYSVSCSSAGNCVAAGSFSNAAGYNEAFTQTQTNGQWADAIPATFASGIQFSSPNANFKSVSCSSAGNCVAAGGFTNAEGAFQPLTQTQTNGQWADAIPATFASGIQNAGPYAYFQSVSCPSAGNCVASGQFSPAAGGQQPFTQTQTNGQWADAIPATFASGIQSASNPYAYFFALSCSSAGNCVAAGQFVNATGSNQAFTQAQTNGQWATATPVTFAQGIQSTSPNSWFQSVSCSSAGNCVAAGVFNSAGGGFEAFTQTQTNGQWATAAPVTFAEGMQFENEYTELRSVSCSSAGNCVGVGGFVDAVGNYQAFTYNVAVTDSTPTPKNDYINSITQAKAWANVDFTLPALTTGKYDRVAYSVDGGSWTSWGLNAKSVQSIKGLPTGREYSIRIRGHVKRGAWTEPSEAVKINMKKIRKGVVVP